MNIWVGVTAIIAIVGGIPCVRAWQHARDAERNAELVAAHCASAEAQRSRNEDEENRRFVLTVSGSQIEDWSGSELDRLIKEGWLTDWTDIPGLNEVLVEEQA